MLRELHCRIEGAHQAVLHDTRDGKGPPKPAKVSLYRRWGHVGWQLKWCQLRLRRDLFVARTAPGTSLVYSRGDH
jgi:hypothetical protein